MAASAGAIRVLIAAGGTGGHLYPGIAIAEEWMRLHPDSRVLFVGTTRGPETKAVPRAGYELQTIAARGLPRRPGPGWILALAGLARALVQSFRLVVNFKPHVVLGTGGYVSAPVVLVAKLFGIPVILQEQNSIPGATNRWLKAYTIVVVTDTAMVVKVWPGHALTYVVNRKSGAPIAEL